MSLIFIAPNRNMQSWKEALRDEDPNLVVEIWPEIKNVEQVQFAVTWQQPAHVLQQYPNLKAISSLGAGVDHILAEKSIHDNIPVCRIIAPNLVQQMKQYIFNAVLNYQQNMHTYFRQRQQGIWGKLRKRNIAKMSVGIMGLGSLGKPIARQLSNFGYHVLGWSKNEKKIEGVRSYTGSDGLEPFLSQTNILICLLPLTAETQDILDLNVFRQLQQPGYLINVARGKHLVEEDLIYALDKGWLAGACLDVFKDEPLPQNHPFWNRSNIMITPHMSSITEPTEVAPQIVENYKRLLSGIPLINKIDKQKGY